NQHLAALDAAGGGDDPDARAEHELAACDRDRLAKPGEQAIGRTHGIPVVGVLEEQGELVAAEPGDGVARPDGRAEAPADLLAECVSGIVAEAVVDLLEAVQVDEEDRERLARSPRANE